MGISWAPFAPRRVIFVTWHTVATVPPPRAITSAEPMPTGQSYLSCTPAYTDLFFSVRRLLLRHQALQISITMTRHPRHACPCCPQPLCQYLFVFFRKRFSYARYFWNGRETVKVVDWTDSAKGGLPSSSMATAVVLNVMLRLRFRFMISSRKRPLCGTRMEDNLFRRRTFGMVCQILITFQPQKI